MNKKVINKKENNLHRDSYKIAGELISNKRLKKSLTRTQLAEILKVKCSYIQNIEEGLTSPKLECFFRMCQYLDIDTLELLETYFPSNKELTELDEKIEKLIEARKIIEKGLK